MVDYDGMETEYRELRRRRSSLRHPVLAKIGDLHVWTLKERLQAFLDGPAGVTIEGVNVLLSLVLVAVAIADTYYDPALGHDSDTYQIFEVVCTALFAADYVMHLYAAQNRLSYFISPVGIVDFITIVPTLLTLAIKRLTLNSVLPILRIARIFRILAVLRLYRVMQSHRGFEYRLSVLIFLLLSLILVAAGVFQILEESYYTDQGLDPLEFHQAMYFVFVTLSTVGYGDISPHTTAGQFFVIFIIVVVVTVIPREITRLIELSALQHDYTHSYSLRRRSIHNGGHVVVTGHVCLENASAFLKEFYRPRQGRVNMDVVFLADHVPSLGLHALLLNVRYRRRTTYLKGNLLHDRDAKRAHIAEAAAVFILANKSDPRQVEATDALSILQALAIDKFRVRACKEYQQQFEQRPGGDNDGENGSSYCSDDGYSMSNEEDEDKQRLQEAHSRSIRCFTEILSLKQARGLRTITGVEVALNTSQLRTAILARNVVCPGATALLLNLIYSPTERHLMEARRSRTPWVAEYAGGLQNLLFPVLLPACFDGVLFEHAAETMYLHFHVMLIALYDRSAMQRGEKSIRLCPFGERLEKNDLVFVIAPSSSIAKQAIDSLREVECYRNLPPENASFSYPMPPVHGPVVPGNDSSRGESAPVLVFSSDSVLDRQSMNNDVGPIALDVHAFSDSQSEAVDALAFSPTTIASSDASTVTSSEFSSPPGVQNRQRLGFRRRVNNKPLPCSTSSSLDSATRQKLLDHILICGPFDQGHQLANYLNELYTHETSLGTELRPNVVLLVKTLPSAEEIEALPCALPTNVFIERGMSENVEDLLRVRAYEARCVLLLPGVWDADSVDFTSDDFCSHLDDYQVIMSTLALRTMEELYREHLQQQPAETRSMRSRLSLDGCSVVRSHSSIKFFAYKSHAGIRAPEDTHSTRSDDEEDSIAAVSDVPRNEYENERLHDHRRRRWGPLKRLQFNRRPSSAPVDYLSSPCFSPTYAAGEVFVDCVLDTLLCQSFFNPYVVDLVRALAGDYYSDETRSSPHATFKASMMRYFSSVDGSDDGRQKGGANTVNPCPMLRVATISRELEGASFAEVFSRALSQQVMVLSVYRRAQAGSRGNALPYVATCPESPFDCVVERGDQLHVLTKVHGPVSIRLHSAMRS
ncbi:hypothetical protein PF001_g8566 [Phytophthora fragariae]|uniref:Calcium-activated potassium channel BK alpha subunit domain-containing protein n=1 Tax=Phytophthora fragariae TaxID=53985 RepID=A0A6A3U5R8_9STRA|nr:hypothetical protein PF006_g8675 [Phytophthora fragariae]KAE9313810.1 hypothetical protein PF001_g8566 [Phytophthora fragariae]